MTTERLALREFRDSDIDPLYNPASAWILEKCGFTYLRYEPALGRNHCEVDFDAWTALA